MRLIAIRHGEAEWNLQRREMGQLDSALTNKGIAQAHAIANRLADIPFQALYTSDLGRAVKTSEIIGRRCGCAPIVLPGLRERHMGIFQGLTLDEMRQKFPREREAYERGGADFIIPQGESARQRLERTVRQMTDLALAHRNDTIVTVTHGVFLMGFLGHVLGLSAGSGSRF